jgi:hypothetical protein
VDCDRRSDDRGRRPRIDVGAGIRAIDRWDLGRFPSGVASAGLGAHGSSGSHFDNDEPADGIIDDNRRAVIVVDVDRGAIVDDDDNRCTIDLDDACADDDRPGDDTPTFADEHDDRLGSSEAWLVRHRGAGRRHTVPVADYDITRPDGNQPDHDDRWRRATGSHESELHR